MQIIDLVAKNIADTLTCSEVAEILADQQNTSDSHLHMHMRDGFATYSKLLFVADTDGARHHYEEAHMTSPERVKNIGKVPVLAPGAKPPKTQFALDPKRMARAEPGPSQRSKYDYRSNRPEVPEVPETGVLVPHVQRRQPQAAPIDVCISDELSPIPVTGAQGRDPGQRNQIVANRGRASFNTTKPGPFVPVAPQDLPKVKYIYVQQQAHVPRLKGSEKHTMFEDSESMILHLAAALRSTAALHMLNLLLDKKLNDNGTVGLFSKTAVWQVQEHVRRVGKKQKKAFAEPKVVERVTDPDLTKQRTPAEPNPVLDTFTYSNKAIDHIVLVMGRRADGQLNFVTLYPSSDSTQQTIGTTNAPDLDIEEPVFGGPKTAVKMEKTYTPLKW